MDRRHRIALAIVTASFLAAGLAVAASGLDRHVAIYPPQQLPLTFSHAQHIQGGAECVTCHDPARKSTMAGDWLLPKHPECEDCHDIQGASEGKQVDPPAAWPTVRVMGSVGKSAPEALLPPPTLPPHALSARSEVAAVTPTSAVRNEVFFMGSPEGVRDRNRPTGAREDPHPCEWHHKRIGSRA